jgi:hypothetical protein
MPAGKPIRTGVGSGYFLMYVKEVARTGSGPLVIFSTSY